jgi:carbamate kinase
MGSRTAVVAIGGNSMIKDRMHQTVRDQYVAAQETCRHIVAMIGQRWEVAIGYLERGGTEALVTNPENVERALAGETGTRFTRA